MIEGTRAFMDDRMELLDRAFTWICSREGSEYWTYVFEALDNLRPVYP